MSPCIVPDGAIVNGSVSDEHYWGFKHGDSQVKYYFRLWITQGTNTLNNTQSYDFSKIGQPKFIDLSMSRFLYASGRGSSFLGCFGDQAWIYDHTVNFKTPANGIASMFAEICVVYIK